MDPEETGEGSVSRWLDPLRESDPRAAQEIWERYFDRLVRLARQKLGASRRKGGDADEEDAALSAFASFCAGAAAGKFPMLADREDLWRLLVVITARKAGAQAQRRRAKKRGGDWHAIGAPSHGDDDLRDELAEIAGTDPSPEFAAQVAEEYDRLLDRLGDDELRRVAVMRLEGFSNDEIAARLGCALRTVARRLELIRREWMDELGPDKEGGPPA
jgi:DNA-directed RNA polymerase specialized sigma24 family protein